MKWKIKVMFETTNQQLNSSLFSLFTSDLSAIMTACFCLLSHLLLLEIRFLSVHILFSFKQFLLKTTKHLNLADLYPITCVYIYNYIYIYIIPFNPIKSSLSHIFPIKTSCSHLFPTFSLFSIVKSHFFLVPRNSP